MNAGSDPDRFQPLEAWGRRSHWKGFQWVCLFATLVIEGYAKGPPQYFFFYEYHQVI